MATEPEPFPLSLFGGLFRRVSHSNHCPRTVISILCNVCLGTYLILMILNLPNDVSLRILSDFVLLKGLVQLDIAHCCKQRQSFHQLLCLLKLQQKVILSREVRVWLSRHQIKTLSLQIEDYIVDEVLLTSELFQRLQLLKIKFNFGFFPIDQLLTSISSSCPRLLTIQLQATHNLSCANGHSALFRECVELKNFHIYNIFFPPETWTELCHRQISFLCVTEYSAYMPEIVAATGPLPVAIFYLLKPTECRQCCAWNLLSIAEVSKLISTFLPQKRITEASYRTLCRGSHFSMFGKTFGALEYIQLFNCADMDERTLHNDLAAAFYASD